MRKALLVLFLVVGCYRPTDGAIRFVPQTPLDDPGYSNIVISNGTEEDIEVVSYCGVGEFRTKVKHNSLGVLSVYMPEGGTLRCFHFKR